MHRKPLLGLVAALTWSLAVEAQVKPEDTIKYRKGLMQVQAWALRPIAQMVKGEIPVDRDALVRYAAVIELTSRMVAEGYPPGTERGSDTRSRPEVWSDNAKFRQAVERFHADSTKLVEAARVGTVDAVRAPFAAVAKGCTGCHDNYRSR
jgi:cytochrome c556